MMDSKFIEVNTTSKSIWEHMKTVSQFHNISLRRRLVKLGNSANIIKMENVNRIENENKYINLKRNEPFAYMIYRRKSISQYKFMPFQSIRNIAIHTIRNDTIKPSKLCLPLRINLNFKTPIKAPNFLVEPSINSDICLTRQEKDNLINSTISRIQNKRENSINSNSNFYIVIYNSFFDNRNSNFRTPFSSRLKRSFLNSNSNPRLFSENRNEFTSDPKCFFKISLSDFCRSFPKFDINHNFLNPEKPKDDLKYFIK